MIFIESPWPILILGLVVEAALAVALARTGRGALLWAMGGVAAAVLLGVFIERSVVTDRKLVVRTLDGAAAGLTANNFNLVNAFISPTPDGDAARDEVRWALKEAECLDVSIRNLEVKFNYTGQRPTAKATFDAIVHVKVRETTFAGEYTRPVAIEVDLRKESGQWLIINTPRHNAREQPRL